MSTVTGRKKQRNLLTIATSKEVYIEMASNLARSFFLWHPNSDIDFYIVTDRVDLIPVDVNKLAKIIEVASGSLGKGFSAKLFLDKLAPEGQTLFIDSDCLIFGKLDFVFERFNGKSVSVVGKYISSGEWFGNIEAICATYEVPHLPKFNGGIYYLEKGTTSTEVYDTARSLEKKYDDIGFKRLRNLPNDEVIMALAMQLHKQEPIVEDGTIMSDLQSCQGPYKLDVLAGVNVLTNPPKPNPMHQAWYPFENVSPIVVHFLGNYTEHYPYRREVYLLKKALNKQMGLATKFMAKFSIEYPSRVKEAFKNNFRSVFHRFFGIRKVKKSKRA